MKKYFTLPEMPKLLLRPAVLPLITLFEYTQIYPGIFCTTDVIAGYCFPYMRLILCTRLIDKKEKADKTI